MIRSLGISHDLFPLSAPFRISRGVKTEVDLVTVSIAEAGYVGRGEGAPQPRYGEPMPAVIAAIEAVRGAIEAGAGRDEIGRLMPPGAARNAVDCALWDLEARLAGTSVAALLGLPPVGTIPTAMTVSLDSPEAMGHAALALRAVPLIKAKVDRSDPIAQIRAVREAAPEPTLIVDPNESWSFAEVEGLQSFLREMRVDLLEQPLPAGADDALSGLSPLVPIAADESAHVADDIAVLAARYQVINIKLDKAGGLTAALALAEAARAHGLGVMIGSMISSSLSIAPALLLAADAAFADLDGPLWLSHDRAGGVTGRNGMLAPPAPGFWGTRQQ